jgi:hypothetical protein
VPGKRPVGNRRPWLQGIAGLALIPLAGWWADSGGEIACSACPLAVPYPCSFCGGDGRVPAYRLVFDPPPDAAAVTRERATRCLCGLEPRGQHPECEWSELEPRLG